MKSPMDVHRHAGSVLWVAACCEAPPRSGGALRSHRLIEALRAAGIGVEVVHAGWSGVAGRALALARGWPLSAAHAWTPRHARRVRAAQRAGCVVVADDLASSVVPILTARTIVALQNVESARAPMPTRGVRRRFDAWLERRGVCAIERRLLRSPAELVVVSQRDAQLLGRGLVVRNGADVPVHPPPPGAGSPVFVGALDYRPNEDAVRWWASDVWPRLRSRAPLVVVGRRAGEVLGDLRGHPAIALVGEVADVAPHLAAAAFAVVPLRAGEGTRLKVLEAMAHARPVVGTRKALEGLDLGEADGVVEADGAEALAAAVDALVVDRARVRALAQRARDRAKDFAWDVVSLPFVELVRRMLAQESGWPSPNRR